MGHGHCDVSSQKECSVKCFPSALAICIPLSPGVPPHPKAEITANLLAGWQSSRIGVHTCLILFVFTFDASAFHFQSSSSLSVCAHVVFVCINQLFGLKLVSCITPGYIIMPPGQGFAKHPSASLTATWWLCLLELHHYSVYHTHQYSCVLLIFMEFVKPVACPSTMTAEAASLLRVVLKAGSDSNRLLGSWRIARNLKWRWRIRPTLDLYFCMFSFPV